ncbi:desulfoferrodoxin family protein [Cetobacterium sp. SF1]|uniref:desulfoferrodoxin family protein n=1 Tax=unclassified Cetobacterium TaxID=2630983 RepID=UPI003CEA4460
MKQFDMFKCEKCGTIVEGVLINKECCGDIEGLQKLEVKSADSTVEKHVPYIEEKEDGYLVKVGKETAHPMLPEHYIEMIEIYVDDFQYRKFLKPGDVPEAYFKVPKGKVIMAREYCNLHGLWKNN